MQFANHRRTALQYPLVHWTLCRYQQYGAFSMKALARYYQVILLGEQRHIWCEQLSQGCCPNNTAAGVKPARPLDHESNVLPLHRGRTSSVHGADHIGTTTSVHIGVQLRYTERALYVPFHNMQISSST